jgi:hypothetical protein
MEPLLPDAACWTRSAYYSRKQIYLHLSHTLAYVSWSAIEKISSSLPVGCFANNHVSHSGADVSHTWAGLRLNWILYVSLHDTDRVQHDFLILFAASTDHPEVNRYVPVCACV